MTQQQTEIKMGQRWSAWVAGRQQWLLASVVQQKAGRVTLKFDARYGLCHGDDEREVEEQDLLGTPNLFRHVGSG